MRPGMDPSDAGDFGLAEMISGIKHVRDAVGLLAPFGTTDCFDDARSDGRPPWENASLQRVQSRVRLAEAFRSVWAATSHWSAWPGTLKSQADELVDLFFRHGAIDTTAQRMSEEEATQAVELIRRFAADAEIACDDTGLVADRRRST